ncbi:agmatinase [Pseudonocardia acaciae]|uniref:agmatinase n=1 Tax=Pseudonocardia acaciae TaxID=551276 RepID=UPI0005697502|nr:agmatinase [Pseudonocardia acaciae]
MTDTPIGPVLGTDVPRFAGPSTFARLPAIDRVSEFDVAFLGAPFDGGTSYRPGARFGPLAVRTASRHLRPTYHPDLEVAPFQAIQAVDAGDVPVNPFAIAEAVDQIDNHARELLSDRRRLITIGGDHTIALPLLRAAHRVHGPLALIHFDAHLDTWDTYFGAPITHGTMFRRAYEEGLLAPDSGIHIGIRGPLYDSSDLFDDARFGFQVIRAGELDLIGIEETAARIRRRVGDQPVYLSVDIDVLDPAFAPGTGTPEMGGFTSRELLHLLRRLTDLPIVAADVVEVAPAYDHAEVTALAAATVAFDICTLMSRRPTP